MRRNFKGGKARDFRHGEKATSRHYGWRKHFDEIEREWYFSTARTPRTTKKAEVKSEVLLDLAPVDAEFWSYVVYGHSSEEGSVHAGYAVTRGFSYKTMLRYLRALYSVENILLFTASETQYYWEDMTLFEEADLTSEVALGECGYFPETVGYTEWRRRHLSKF